MPTKIEIVYNKVYAECENIKEKFNYDNLSSAFGHFIIENIFKIDDQKASESITDGFNDNGIDAVYIQEEENNKIVNFFQFKFPKFYNLKNGFTEEEIVKLGNGVQNFLESTELKKEEWADSLIEKYSEIREFDAFDIKLWLIKFTTAEYEQLDNKLKNICKRIKKSILNECSYIFYAAQEISQLYESRYENKYPDLNIISYTNQVQTYNGDGFKSINTVCSIKELYESVKDQRNQMFDGNVRYYDSKTEVTKGIKQTLLEYPEKFIVLNNGITILTEKADYNMSTLKFKLYSASIINGAQTVGTILNVLDELIKNEESLEKYENSTILIRILEIKDEESLINKIVNSLNTQTKMFSAYNISNDSRLKEIQSKLNNDTEKPYFLEIKYNEYNTKKGLSETKKYKKNVISSEKLIQIFVGYYDTKDKAHISKSQSSELLGDSDLINKVLNDLNYEIVTILIDIYYEIQQVISMFRGYRNFQKKEIIEYLEIEDGKKIDDYQFLTTGDILVLFVVGILTNKKIENLKIKEDRKKYIKNAIEEIKKYIKNISRGKKLVMANITKSKNTFQELKSRIYKK